MEENAAISTKAFQKNSTAASTAFDTNAFVFVKFYAKSTILLFCLLKQIAVYFPEA